MEKREEEEVPLKHHFSNFYSHQLWPIRKERVKYGKAIQISEKSCVTTLQSWTKGAN